MSPSTLAWRCLLPHAAGPLARSSHAMAVVGTTVRIEIVGARTVGSSLIWLGGVFLWLDNICARTYPHPKIKHTHTHIHIHTTHKTQNTKHKTQNTKHKTQQAYLFGGENVPRVPVDAHLHTLNLLFAGEGEGGGAKWEQLVGGCRVWCFGLVGFGWGGNGWRVSLSVEVL